MGAWSGDALLYSCPAFSYEIMNHTGMLGRIDASPLRNTVRAAFPTSSNQLFSACRCIFRHLTVTSIAASSASWMCRSSLAHCYIHMLHSHARLAALACAHTRPPASARMGSQTHFLTQPDTHPSKSSTIYIYNMIITGTGGA